MAAPTQNSELVEEFSSRLATRSLEATRLVKKRAKRSAHSSFIGWLLIADVLVAMGIHGGVGWARYGSYYFTNQGYVLGLLVTGVLVVASALVGAYDKRVSMASLQYVCEQLIASLIVLITVAFISFFLPDRPFGVGRFLISTTVLPASAVMLLIRRAYSLSPSRASSPHYTIVVEDGDCGALFARWLEVVKSDCKVYYANAFNGLIYSSNHTGRSLVGATVEDAIDRLGDGLDAIVIATSTNKMPATFLNRLVAINYGVLPVYTLEAFYARMWKAVPLSTLEAPWALGEGFELSNSATYRRFKRCYDIVGSAIALMLLSPLLCAVAIAVKLDSKGPVIFRQTRIGLREMPFTLFKFRTMRCGSENGACYTDKRDSRITRVGKILRLTRLDELPQLFNVLRGDMSLIGPRAEWDRLVKDYERVIPYYHFRHLIKPGITGWAQVNYPYGSNLEDTKNKLRYDLYYVKHYSFNLDACIVIKTIYVMFFGKGR